MTFIPDSCRNDTEYMSYISDLVDDNNLQSLHEITHHYHSTRLKHCFYVSYTSYLMAKKMNLNVRETARAGLLHDFFLEDYEEIDAMQQGSHAQVHPQIAVVNAENLTPLSEREKDIILSHMFLTCTKSPVPQYKESVIVTMMDKYCAVNEFVFPVKKFVSTYIQKVQNVFATQF